MEDLLFKVFGWVCGQNPAHTWSCVAGSLPCCERCTGLYAGAFLALLLQWLIRPPPTGNFLKLHGFFLLVMVAFGFHWLPQGPFLRMATGLLFGFGLVAFLGLKVVRWEQIPTTPANHRLIPYLAGLALALGFIAYVSHTTTPAFFNWLRILVAAGLLALGVLVAGNLRLGMIWLSDRLPGLLKRVQP
jgi:uncharacterized membrane protein